eukprot:3940691-Rhodomonas_salina.1
MSPSRKELPHLQVARPPFHWHSSRSSSARPGPAGGGARHCEIKAFLSPLVPRTRGKHLISPERRRGIPEARGCYERTLVAAYSRSVPDRYCDRVWYRSTIP